MEFMAKAEKKLKAFSLFGNKKEEALELCDIPPHAAAALMFACCLMPQHYCLLAV
jgi:hypothetical protein